MQFLPQLISDCYPALQNMFFLQLVYSSSWTHTLKLIHSMANYVIKKHEDIFDRVPWPTMWVALGEQGVPEHFVRLLVSAYDEQLGEVMGKWGKTAVFHNSRMRHGPALNPRLFIAVLDAMEDKNWKRRC